MKQMIICETPTLLVSPQALQQSSLSHSYKEVLWQKKWATGWRSSGKHSPVHMVHHYQSDFNEVLEP